MSNYPRLRESHPHIPALDGLRAIAALIVSVSHCLLVIPINGVSDIANRTLSEPLPPDAKITQLLLVFLNGGFAVTLFFVLSGYVLGKSLQKAPITLKTFRDFYLKRLFRLYPAYILVLLFTLLFLYTSFSDGHFKLLGEWINRYFHMPLSVKEVAANIVFKSVSLSGVTWTLQYELLGSILLPVMVLLQRKISLLQNVIVFFILLLCASVTNPHSYSFIPLFFGGSLLSRIRLQDLPSSPVVMGVTFFIVLSMRSYVPESVAVIAEALFVLYLIASVVSIEYPTLSRFLNSHAIAFLGKISYSFYLFHFLVLYTLTYFVVITGNLSLLSRDPIIGTVVLVCSTILITTLISSLSFRFIEQQGVRLGNHLLTLFK